MAMKAGAIRVEGLRELNKALRELGPEARAELKGASQTVADFVASDSRAAASALGGVAAKVAPSITGRSSMTGSAGVALGGARFPMAAGAAFGAAQNQPRTRSTGTYLGFNQFKPWRGSGPTAGYFLYPQIRQNAERIVAQYTTAIDQVIRKVGLAG